MKIFPGATALLAAMAACTAHAETFNFSYTFEDSTVLTGSLVGDLSGDYVTNISDVHVFLNGNEFSGEPLFHAAWNTTTQDWDNTTEAKVSTKADLNNFILADANVPTDFGVTNYFYFVNDPTSAANGVFATNLNTGDIALDSAHNSSWSLTPASSVPLPAALPLLISGLGMLGAAARRRQQV